MSVLGPVLRDGLVRFDGLHESCRAGNGTGRGGLERVKYGILALKDEAGIGFDQVGFG